MAQHCPKHDVTFSEGGVCWCCEQAKKKEAEASKPADVPASDSEGK